MTLQVFCAHRSFYFHPSCSSMTVFGSHNLFTPGADKHLGVSMFLPLLI